MPGSRPAPAPEHIDRLRETFGGDVITPDHEAYDDARRVWNTAFDRRYANDLRPDAFDALIEHAIEKYSVPMTSG